MNKNRLNKKSLRSPAQRSAPFLVIVSLLALTSMVCQCTPGANPSATPNSNGSLTDAEELQAVERANEVYHQSMDPDGVPDMVQLLYYLGSDPAFEAYGPSPDGSVWAHLTNGRWMTFLAPTLEAPVSSSHPTAGLSVPIPVALPEYQAVNSTISGSEASSPILADDEKFELPSNDLVLIMNSLPARFGVNPETLKRWFKDKKYDPIINDIQVDYLKFNELGIQYGVFYLATHGGVDCSEPTENHGCGRWVMTLATNTLVTEENKRAYAEDLDAHRLVYQSGIETSASYGFTEYFVSEHMSFPANSLVFIDACSGYLLQPAFSGVGASVFISWDNPAGRDSKDYFFARMLGINEISLTYDPPKPFNRPFDYEAVFLRMQQKTLTQDYYGEDVYVIGPDGKPQKSGRVSVRANLIYFHAGGSFGILRPTIERLEVDEENEKLIIVGAFGSEEGEVYMNDTQLEAAWGSKKIEADLPAADDSDGKGIIYVKVRDHESNRVPLTLWHVKFTYTEGPDQTINAYQWLDLDIYWRADLHQYRLLPDGELQHQDAITLEPAEASSATWRCQWEGSYAGISFSTESGEGSLTLTYDADPSEFMEDGTYSSTGTLDGDIHQIVDLQFIVNYDPETTCLVKTTGYGVSSTSALGFVLLPGLLRNVGDTPGLEPLLLDEKYILTEGNRDLMNDGIWPFFEWKDAKPESPPKDGETEG